MQLRDKALVVAHGALQPPQLLASVPMFISQPFVTWESQLAKFGLQVMPQLPPLQLAVPFWEGHGALQLPQWLVSVLRLRSQPFAALRSQLPKPLLQLIEQLPALQLAMPPVELQTVPQPPQLLTSFCRSISQPSSVEPACGPLQSEKPPLQV